MTERQSIKWPYGFTGERRRHPMLDARQDMTRAAATNFVVALQDMEEDERREFLTWLREIIDHYGYDSATAIERGIDVEGARGAGDQ